MMTERQLWELELHLDRIADAAKYVCRNSKGDVNLQGLKVQFAATDLRKLLVAVGVLPAPKADPEATEAPTAPQGQQ